MAEIRASTVQQRREEVYAALQYAASFHCLVETGKIVKTVFTKTKSQKTASKETSDGVVCTTKQISVHGMRKKQQQDNNARKM